MRRQRPGRMNAVATLAVSGTVAMLSILSVPSIAVAAGRSAGDAAARSAADDVTQRTVSRNTSDPDVSDSFIATGQPRRAHGTLPRLVVSGEPGNRKVAFMKFRVGGIPKGANVTHVSLTLTKLQQRRSASRLVVSRVRPDHWNQHSLTAARAPQLGARVATGHINGSSKQLTFHVRNSVRTNGLYAFAVGSRARHGVQTFSSREARRAPRLEVHYEYPVQVDQPQPGPAPTPTPTPTTPTETPTPTPTTPETSSGCTLSSELVPSCGVLFGGALSSYGGTDLMSQYRNFNSGADVDVSLQHDYRRPGQTLSDWDMQVAKTPGAILQLNWKPAYTWADAAGSNPAVNAQIDAMANSIKALGSSKIFLTIFHEPENDVSGGASNCPGMTYRGTAGTPADYRAMWANVESRFAADGVSNVVWDMNYMNYVGWDCLVNDLWPGNALVDWVFFESYSPSGSTFAQQTGRFYNLLANHSDPAHDYLSKPWGVGEFGTRATSGSEQLAYYAGIKQALDTNQFPRLKLLSAFDAIGPAGDYRIAYDANGLSSPAEVDAFHALADDPLIAGPVQAVLAASTG